MTDNNHSEIDMAHHEADLKQARKTLEWLETILEIKRDSDDLSMRIEGLKEYF